MRRSRLSSVQNQNRTFLGAFVLTVALVLATQIWGQWSVASPGNPEKPTYPCDNLDQETLMQEVASI